MEPHIIIIIAITIDPRKDEFFIVRRVRLRLSQWKKYIST